MLVYIYIYAIFVRRLFICIILDIGIFIYYIVKSHIIPISIHDKFFGLFI